MSRSDHKHGGLTDAQAKAMDAAAFAARAYRDEVADMPARPTLGLDEAAGRFLGPLPETGMPEDDVIAQIVRDARGGLHNMASPKFFGYVIGASHPVGVAADMLVSAWGQNSGTSFETPAVTGMERSVCDWVIDLLSLPSQSGAGLVTGGTVANMVGVMAARHKLLDLQGWNVEADGLFGAPEFPVLIGRDAHSAPFAALRYAGLGAARVRQVETDSEGRISAASFQRELEQIDTPPLVILQAGQINTGAFDPFAELIPMVREAKGWVHVDGAFGLWLAAVPELEDRLAGVRDADSWAIDLHKWLNAPYDAGIAIVRDREPLVASMSARGAYLPEKTAHWEPSDSTPELSRRARGVPSYAILKHLGAAGVREMIARHCRLATRIADTISTEPGLAVVNDIHSNQIAIACGGNPSDDGLTMRTLKRVQERGKVYPTHGEWAGRQIIRASVIGYAMTEADADLLSTEVIDAFRWCTENSE